MSAMVAVTCHDMPFVPLPNCQGSDIYYTHPLDNEQRRELPERALSLSNRICRQNSTKATTTSPPPQNAITQSL